MYPFNLNNNKDTEKKAILLYMAVLIFFIALLALHKLSTPALESLDKNALKKSYEKSTGLCSAKAKIALVSSEPNRIQIKKYCGLLGVWKHTQTKFIPKVYLETEFSALETRDYLVKAKEHYDNNQSTEAVNQLKKAIYLEPKNTQAYLLLSAIYYRSGSKQKALVPLHKAISINPHSSDITSAFASLYIKEDDFVQAYTYAKKSLKLESNAANLIQLAEIETHLNMRDKAIEHYERSLHEDPSNAQALNELGLLYWQRQDFTQAARAFQKAYESYPDQALYFLNYYELTLITPTPLSEKESKNFLQKNQDIQETVCIYDALNIIGLSIANQDTTEAIKHWEQSYNGQHLNWSFTQIRRWLDTSTLDIEHKQHIQNTIGYFIGYQHAYKIINNKEDT